MKAYNYQDLLNELDNKPKIQTSAVDVDGVMVEAAHFKVVGKNKTDVENRLASALHQSIEGKKVWVRKMPQVVEVEDDFVGTARIVIV